MSKIYLVTGATGFIGAHLVRAILASGDRVKILSRQKSLPPHLADLVQPGVELVQGDLLEPASFRAHLRGLDGIYHLAGFISTSPNDAQRVLDLNYTVTHNLLAELRVQPVPRVVYLASIFALAGGEKTPANEDTPYNLAGNPVGYFHAKRCAELEMRAAAEYGMDIVFTYPCFCYGPGDALISSSRLLLMYLRGQMPMYFHGGLNSMDVRDAANALLLSMHKGQAGRRYLAGGVNQTYREFFKVASEVTGLRPVRWGMPSALLPAMGLAGEHLMPRLGLDTQAVWMAQRYWYYDDSRARTELGHVSRPLAETLRDATRWFVDNGFCKKPPSFS